MQRVANAIVYLMAQAGHKTLAYVDDYCGVHPDFTSATRAFSDFERLCSQLGLQSE